MSSCPEYRVRLFLSVDLVGSTAYKAAQGSIKLASTVLPRWVDETRHFYREYPIWLRNEFSRQVVAARAGDEPSPEVWKTVGDEIIFCVRLRNYHHLARCIDSFLKTLVEYSKYLEDKKIPLDVKGVGWTAAFPAPNITVALADKHAVRSSQDSDFLTNEAIEQESDSHPANFEYLGKEIDAGFRVSKHAGADRFALSLELAYLLAHGCAATICTFPLMYHGRESMKGVINGRPYPVVTIDTERKTNRRKVRTYEHAITGEKEVSAEILRSFLHAFMEDENVELPILPIKDENIIQSAYPSDYLSFRLFWLEQNKELNQRNKLEDQAVEENGSVIPNDPSIVDPLATTDNRQEIREYLKEVGSRFRDS